MAANRTLEVRIDGVYIGLVMPRANGNFRFEYDAAYVARATRIPLSHSMPITKITHGTREIGNWMWNLLPDNETTLDRWAQLLKVSARNPAALLAAMGEDCPGAVQLTPPGFDLAEREGVKWLSRTDIEARIEALHRDSAAGRIEGDQGQFSLAGAQAKTALYRTAKRWGVPKGRTPTTHILKPEPQRLPDLAIIEHFSLELARASGLPSARSEVELIGGIPTIIVQRFDRYRAGRTVRRIHAEDGCQALGVPPWRKYQDTGGPGIPEIMRLLRASRAPDIDRERFFRAQAFNFVIAGTDAHAKNYSLLYAPGGEFRLTPLYDVISALPYTKRRSDLKLAMTIGGKRTIDEIMPRHWIRMARACDLPEELTLGLVADAVSRLPDMASETAKKLHSVALSTIILDKLVDLIANNAARITRRFGF